MAHARLFIILCLVVQLIGAGVLHAQTLVPGGSHEPHAAQHHDLHAAHSHATADHDAQAHHQSGECSMCANCLAATVGEETTVRASVSRAQPVAGAEQPPNHRIDTLLRPPRYLI